MLDAKKAKRSGYAAVESNNHVTIYRFNSRKERNKWLTKVVVAEDETSYAIGAEAATTLLATRDGRTRKYTQEMEV
jgi:hypothetical protein